MLISYEDPTDDDGMTALMRAVIRGAKLVELLIPAHNGMKDKAGNTVFMHDLKNKHTSIALLLHKHGASS